MTCEKKIQWFRLKIKKNRGETRASLLFFLYVNVTLSFQLPSKSLRLPSHQRQQPLIVSPFISIAAVHSSLNNRILLSTPCIVPSSENRRRFKPWYVNLISLLLICALFGL